MLVDAGGPVIIDFPQAVDASRNRNARKLLVRDVQNLHNFLAKYVPGRKPPRYAEEMWQLYERSELSADTRLTGRFQSNDGLALTDDVLALVAEAERDEKRRRDALGIKVKGGRGHVPELARPKPPQKSPGHDRAPPKGPGHDRAPQRPGPNRGAAPVVSVRRGPPSPPGPGAPRAELPPSRPQVGPRPSRPEPSGQRPPSPRTHAAPPSSQPNRFPERPLSGAEAQRPATQANGHGADASANAGPSGQRRRRRRRKRDPRDPVAPRG